MTETEYLPKTLPAPFSFRRMMSELGRPVTTDEINFDPPELARITKPLSESRIGVFVSAGVYNADVQEPFVMPNDFSYRLVDTDWPLDSLTLGHPAAIRYFATQDLNVAYPRDGLLALQREGFVGSLAPQVVSMVGAISAYTELMQSTVPAVYDEFRRQEVDLVLLLPFCPQCHTAVPLIARGLEHRGMPTIMTSCLWEAARAVKAPRTAFLDFPMGCPVGRPHEPQQQLEILRETLTAARTFGTPWRIHELPFQWSPDGGREWEATVKDLYVKDAQAFAKRVAAVGAERETLAGREKEFTIKCAC